MIIPRHNHFRLYFPQKPKGKEGPKQQRAESARHGASSPSPDRGDGRTTREEPVSQATAMRGGEMLTAARGAGAGTTPSTTTTSSAASAAAAAELARAGGVGGGNFPLAVALLAFAFANFINLVAIWCAHPAFFSLPRRSKFLSAIVPTCRLKEKKWDARKFLSSAGVLSSLSATVGSLAVAVGHQEGVNSSEFALALVFAAVVMYDASGVRFHTGRQAAVICDFPPEHPIISTFRPLREPLGHSPLQVFAGALVGCVVAYVIGNSV
ncbi:hypothetical protein PR202_gb02007 [Eleusine coracana subsp. coracana]|uniref:Uncharacterized protein n=1 Tax=Eleusine coracana subsp. coracana TaxID=191504 RepID=A0AAV5DXX9_ELECO|nr:hypothetical protein PR202_gb02007 [Eleusine coracana subsp. coracana]